MSIWKNVFILTLEVFNLYNFKWKPWVIVAHSVVERLIVLY